MENNITNNLAANLLSLNSKIENDNKNTTYSIKVKLDNSTSVDLFKNINIKDNFIIKLDPPKIGEKNNTYFEIIINGQKLTIFCEIDE